MQCGGIEFLYSGGLSVAVSRSVGSTPATVADLLDYERVVAALHANRTVVPLRYSVVENESTVVQLLAGRQREFRELLIRLEGKTELGVRILVKGQPGGTAPAPDSGSSSPGAAYVARIRQRLYSHAPNEAEQDILDRMSRLIAHIENVQLGESSSVAGGRLLSRYLLVSKTAVEDCRRCLLRFQADPPLKFLLTGPWPPYNFVTSQGSACFAPQSF